MCWLSFNLSVNKCGNQLTATLQPDPPRRREANPAQASSYGWAGLHEKPTTVSGQIPMGALGGLINAAIDANQEHMSAGKATKHMLTGIAMGILTAALGYGLGKVFEIIKVGAVLKSVPKNEITGKEYWTGVVKDGGVDFGLTNVFSLKNNRKNSKVSELNPGLVF
jgi:hypothetical protein